MLTPISVTLKMEAIPYSETSVLRRPAPRSFPMDGILRGFKFYSRLLQILPLNVLIANTPQFREERDLPCEHDHS
jgi:hypothetical protein